MGEILLWEGSVKFCTFVGFRERIRGRLALHGPTSINGSALLFMSTIVGLGFVLAQKTLATSGSEMQRYRTILPMRSQSKPCSVIDARLRLEVTWKVRTAER